MAFMTKTQYNKLRAGNSAWRCLIWFNRKDEPYVEITHVLLNGSRTTGGGKSIFNGCPKVGQDYLFDVGHCSFDTYRKARRYQKEIAEGRHGNAVRHRRWSLRDLFDTFDK